MERIQTLIFAIFDGRNIHVEGTYLKDNKGRNIEQDLRTIYQFMR